MLNSERGPGEKAFQGVGLIFNFLSFSLLVCFVRDFFLLVWFQGFVVVVWFGFFVLFHLVLFGFFFGGEGLFVLDESSKMLVL